MADEDRTPEQARPAFLSEDPFSSVLSCIAFVAVLGFMFLAGWVVGASHR